MFGGEDANSTASDGMFRELVGVTYDSLEVAEDFTFR